MLHLGGQVRTVGGADILMQTGWDMTAALALGTARGIDARLLSEWLPPIEAVSMAKMNEE